MSSSLCAVCVTASTVAAVVVCVLESVDAVPFVHLCRSVLPAAQFVALCSCPGDVSSISPPMGKKLSYNFEVEIAPALDAERKLA